MRQLFISLCAIALLASCSSKKKAEFKGHLTKEYLSGTWLVSGSDFSEKRNMPGVLRDTLDTHLLLHLYRFDENGALFSDNADVYPQTGNYESEGKVLKIKPASNNVSYWQLEEATDSSMILLIERAADPFLENAKILLKRINTSRFKIDRPNWKKGPASPMNKTEIRKKLGEMIGYYEQFFRAMLDRDIDMLAHRKILLPIKYFSNGIDLRPFEERKGWDVFFGDSTAARTAYGMLQKAFDDINLFPVRKNFFLLYADIFAMLKKNLESAE